MQRKKKRIASIVALAMAATLTLTACGGTSTTTTPTTTPTVTPTSTPTSNASDTPTTAPTSFKQSPMFDAMKDLAPLEERLPEIPKVTNELDPKDLTYEIGTYGGTMRTVSSSLDWDADVFIMAVEPLVNSPSIRGEVITPNVLEAYEVSDDNKTFTFTLRKGLKWSDGTLVTMEDFRFTWENVIMNKELTPVVPAWLCAGGSVSGNPLTFKVIDDYNFSLTSESPYGGLLLQLSLSAWRGYADLLKPAYFLKPYHKEMKEYNPDLAIGVAEKNNISDDENRWISVFNKVDITHWELTKKEGIGFPEIYPWILKEVDAAGQVYTYERNPYYFKVDSEGNQLPYIDKIQSSQVADMEMVTMKTLAGEVDMSRESAALTNISMYKENEKNGYKTLMTNMHVNPADIWLNMTYDEPTWKEVTQNVDFRRAMAYAIDKDEVIEAAYYGYGEPASSLIDSEFNVDKSNALLDKIGMDKKDKNGNRLAPNGKPFEILFEVGAEAPDIVPVGELVVEMWNNVGVKTSIKRIESSLVGNKSAANEIQARVMWDVVPMWFYQDWGTSMWGKSWDIWRTKTTKATLTNADGTTKEIEVKGEEPPQEVKDFYKLCDDIMIVSLDDAQVTLQKIYDSIKENVWMIPIVENAKQPVIVRANMGNTTESCWGAALDYSGEQLFYK